MEKKLATIDLSQNDAACADELNRAFTKTGFAYVAHHGVPDTLINELTRLARAFFAQPPEQKQAIAMELAGRAWRGYFPVGAEYTAGKPDQKEGIYFGEDHASDSPGVKQKWPMHGQNIWPPGEQFATFPQIVTTYMQHLSSLGQRLMRCVALGLNLDAGYFEERFTTSPTTLFRIFNYPKQADPSPTWGVGEHTDMGFLTILLQDHLGGLEVQTRDHTWIKAPPVDGTFVINIGDMLQYWTHGIYKATSHRVRNISDKDRLSFPFFFDPNWQCQLSPIAPEKLDPTLLEEAQRDTYRQRWDGMDLSKLDPATTYGDFVWNKIKDVFPDLAQSDP